MLRVPIEDYLVELKMSQFSRYLVEGITDKAALQKLLKVKYRDTKFEDAVARSVIDIAERIESRSGNGNREKIINTIQVINDNYLNEKILGIVDREFDFFDVKEAISDGATNNALGQNLLITHGHSIENYYFDKSIISTWIDLLSVYNLSKEIELFMKFFDEILVISTSLTLACLELGYEYRIPKVFDRMIKSLNEDCFILHSEIVIIDMTSWRAGLIEYFPGNEDIILSIYNENMKISSNSNRDVCRWFCHGHLTMKLLAAFFEACVKRIGITEHASIRHILVTTGNTKERLSVLMHIWAERTCREGLPFPEEVFLYLEKYDSFSR